MFCNRLGRPLNGAVLRRRFKRTAVAAGLRVLRFHSLRHGAGSLVARQADARWVQGFLGHSKLPTTAGLLDFDAPRRRQAEDLPSTSLLLLVHSGSQGETPG